MKKKKKDEWVISRVTVDVNERTVCNTVRFVNKVTGEVVTSCYVNDNFAQRAAELLKHPCAKERWYKDKYLTVLGRYVKTQFDGKPVRAFCLYFVDEDFDECYLPWWSPRERVATIALYNHIKYFNHVLRSKIVQI